uniref:Alpha-2-macroglobulin domain-containing protein n=1 Tax=Eutreptiella gymnastica TaxID=73025 RepID=A0A7S4FM98_9EUGL
MDGAKVFPALRLSGPDRSVPLKCQSAAEVHQHLDSDPYYLKAGVSEARSIRACTSRTPPERVVLLKPCEALAKGTNWTLTVGPNVPSAEGPLCSAEPSVREFCTYNRLALSAHGPQAASRSPPQTPLRLTFNNSLDVDEFLESFISVQPPIEDMELSVSECEVNISGRTRARTKYTVTVDAAVKDVYGQRLGQSHTVECEIGAAAKMFSVLGNAAGQKAVNGSECSPLQSMWVLDPMSKTPPDVVPKSNTNGISHATGGPPAPYDHSVVVVNVPRVDVCIVSIEPSMWPVYLNLYMKGLHGMDEALQSYVDELKRLGQAVASGTIPTNCEPDVPTIVHVDLKSAFRNHGPDGAPAGNIIVFVDPNVTEPAPAPQSLPPVIEATEHYPSRYVPDLRASTVWVQATALAANALRTRTEDMVWVTSLETGKPIPGAEVAYGVVGSPYDCDGDGEQWSANWSGTTGANGMITRGADGLSQRDCLIVVKVGDDCCFALISEMREKKYAKGMSLYTFDDRKLYRPGETVHLKGIARGCRPTTDNKLVELWSPGGVPVTLQCFDPGSGQPIWKQVVTTSEYGTFYAEIPLPTECGLGWYGVSCEMGEGGHHYHEFQVQEFRRPEFNVSCTAPSGPPLVTGGSAIVAVHASYFAGGPLTQANVEWTVDSQKTTFSPAGWPAFHFQDAPVWGCFGFRGFQDDDSGPVLRHKSNTNSKGQHRLCIDFKANASQKRKYPVQVKANGTVTDINRQTMSSSASFTVHPSKYYVGIKTLPWARANTSVEVELVVCDVAGKAIADVPLTVRCTSTQRKRFGNDVEVIERWVKEYTSAPGTMCLDLLFDEGGEYTLEARVADPTGLVNTCSASLLVVGRLPRASAKDQNAEPLKLIPNKERYEAGDCAVVTVQSLLSDPCQAVAQLQGRGLLYTECFAIPPGGSHDLRFDVKEEWIPGAKKRLNVDVVVDRSASGTGEGLVGAQAGMDLEISYKIKCLTVDVRPGATHLTPGSKTDVSVSVHNAATKAPAAAADVAIWVVDEAVLALARGMCPRNPMPEDEPEAAEYFISPTPQGYFYGDGTRIEGYARHSFRCDTRVSLLSRNWRELLFEAIGDEIYDECGYRAYGMGMARCMGMAANGMGGPGGADMPIAVRTNFDALACFHGNVRTDAAGACTVPVPLPDSLTKYRVIAVACTAQSAFGMGESAVEVALPLMVRPSLPRFLNVGDHAKLTVVVQNQTSRAADVAVVARTSNLELVGPGVGGFRIHLEPQQRLEVRFEAKTVLPGKAKVQVGAEMVGAAAGGVADAADAEVPVWTPATAEAFAAYGELDPDGAVATHALQPPADVYPAYGGLQIGSSSTILQTVTDAFEYLVEYPFEYVESMASRVLAFALLKDIQTAFASPTIPKDPELTTLGSILVQKLLKAQLPCGGFGFWAQDTEADVFVTLHVAHCFAQVQRKGHKVSAHAVGRLIEALRDLSAFPHWDKYSESTRRTLQCLRCYVLSLFEKAEMASEAAELYNAAGGVHKLGLDAAAWLALAVHGTSPLKATHSIVQSVLKYFANQTVETAGAAHCCTGYEDAGADTLVLLRSSPRTDAIVLEALQVMDPSNAIIPKLMKGLLGVRQRGRWGNTQENVFALLAVDRYFNTYEAATPAFTAHSWLSTSLVADHEHKGRSTVTKVTDVPMKYLVDTAGAAPQPLHIHKVGPGRLYYRLGLKYAPKSNILPAHDAGFIVQRTYKALQDPEDVQTTAQGYKLKSGRLIEVTLTLETRMVRHRVALVDKLPACLEPLNPALAGTPELGGTPPAAGRCCYWRWYDHDNLRDERVEAFAGRVWEGAHTYSYVAQVTGLGEFIAPPATAEEVLSPEVFGRSATLTVHAE